MQLYETHNDFCETREENELLKVKLQAAESEVKEAKSRAVEAQLALAEALTKASPVKSEASPATPVIQHLQAEKVSFFRERCNSHREHTALYKATIYNPCFKLAASQAS